VRVSVNVPSFRPAAPVHIVREEGTPMNDVPSPISNHSRLVRSSVLRAWTGQAAIVPDVGKDRHAEAEEHRER
jgi:hypothetical protein